MLRWPVAFARWDPLQDLLALHERLNRVAGEHSSGWVPAVDLYETPDDYVISVELPGLGRDDFQIAVQDGKVVVKGQRPPRQTASEQYHRVERGHGHFSRSFALPQPIDERGIVADLHDGVLTVTIPKLATRPRRIEVR